MKNLSLAKKLSLSFGVIAAILVAIIGMAVHDFNQAEADLNLLVDVYSASDKMAMKLQINLLTARRHEKDFIARQKDKYRQRHTDTLNLMHDNLTQLEQLATQADIDRSQLSNIGQGITVYQGAFAKIVEQIALQGDKDSGIQGELRKLAHQAEETILTSGDDKLMVDYLWLRRHEKDFILRENNKYIAAVGKDVQRILLRLDQLDLAPQLESTIASCARNYVVVLEQLATTIEVIKQQYPKMSDAVHVIEAAIVELEGLADHHVSEHVLANIESNHHMKSIFYILGALALLCSVIAARVAIRSVTGPVNKIMLVMQQLSMGRLGSRTQITSRDELGMLAQDIDAFADTLENEVVAPLQQLAVGDLTFDVRPRDGQDVVRGALKKVGEDLNAIMGQILTACDQIAIGSGEISDSSQALSQGATESASSMEEIAASMNEMAAQTTINAENAVQATKLSDESKHAAERGNEQMSQMVTAMGEINESGQNISKIIKVIDEIAFQTNLLALNAAVEAARAGQHGKGFAVVAEEVRNLAARSAKAASETAVLIEGSVAKTANGAEIADMTAAGLEEIVTGITKVSDLVGEISVASNEQAQGISQVNVGLGQIDQVTQQNTASAEEGAASSEELSSQAEQLRQMLNSFKLKGQTGQRPQLSAPMASPKSYSAPAAAPAASGWGGSSNDQPMQIALDDDEFGKF